MTAPKKKRKLFVAAAGRSGTQYIARVWKKLGLRIGHEYVGEDGTASSPFVSPRVMYPAVPSRAPKGRCIHIGERRGDFEFEHVFHQVRHPLKVVDSMRWTPTPRNYLDAYGIQYSENPVVRAIRICWLWNKLCEAQAELRYRIEDIDEEFPRQCAQLGIEYPGSMPSVPRTANHAWRYNASDLIMYRETGRRVSYKKRKQIIDSAPKMEWDMVMVMDREYGKRLLAMAVEYGYGKESPW
jgi:hypothetical protein